MSKLAQKIIISKNFILSNILYFIVPSLTKILSFCKFFYLFHSDHHHNMIDEPKPQDTQGNQDT